MELLLFLSLSLSLIYVVLLISCLLSHENSAAAASPSRRSSSVRISAESESRSAIMDVTRTVDAAARVARLCSSRSSSVSCASLSSSWRNCAARASETSRSTDAEGVASLLLLPPRPIDAERSICVSHAASSDVSSALRFARSAAIAVIFDSLSKRRLAMRSSRSATSALAALPSRRFSHASRLARCVASSSSSSPLHLAMSCCSCASTS